MFGQEMLGKKNMGYFIKNNMGYLFIKLLI